MWRGCSIIMHRQRSTSTPLAVAVLAAGSASRFGAPKQLLQIKGQTLAARAALTALAIPADLVVVVVGHEADAVSNSLPQADRLRVVYNPDFARGQGSSVRAAALEVQQQLPNAGLAVLLCDNPFVDAGHIRTVWVALRASLLIGHQAGNGQRAATRWQQPAAARAIHRPTSAPGHPVIFAPATVADLTKLPDHDEAPREYLRSLPHVLTVPFDDDAVIFDVDTPDQFQIAQARLQAR